MSKTKIDDEFDRNPAEPGLSSTTSILPMFGPNMIDISFDASKVVTEGLPLLLLRNKVMIPGVTVSINVTKSYNIAAVKEGEKSQMYIGVIPQLNDADDPQFAELYEKGCYCEVVREIDMPDGSRSVILQPRLSFHLLETVCYTPFVRANVEMLTEVAMNPDTKTCRALLSNIKSDIEEIKECYDNPLSPELAFLIDNAEDPNYVISYLCANFPMSYATRLSLFKLPTFEQRGKELAKVISRCKAYSILKHEMHQQTQVQLNSMQRQQYLRQQIHSIQEELGETSSDDVDKLIAKSQHKRWSQAVQETFSKEVKKLQRMNEQSPDYSIQYNYLQTFVNLPWGETSVDNLNMKHAQRILDRDHYGLKKVKERVLEHLAVLKMRGDMKAPILCLVGPPGVGKTSLGKSIADALGREYVRISLGGLHDEAEIRGHRRTYIGAMPGRIIAGIQKAQSDNPVFVLDEIDKIAADFKGDPSSALLEVLDPEQNKAFHDNYLDVDYDLSNVLFIATANSLAPISEPLRDRMEVIPISGYVLEEKVEIGMRHLLPKQMKEHGLTDIRFSIPRRTMVQIIDRYTRESGVRLLDKALAKVMRKLAWQLANDEPVPSKLQVADLDTFLGKPDYNPEKYDGNDYAGVVTGLAWTSVGGCILEVESTLVPGKGGLTLTGHLGDVMKESAQLALQWIKANADELDINPAIFEQWTAHIHCPEGATPKDGPSAGITMVTSLVSTFTQRKVRARIAMTGEITLRGKVIPIGGVKEKILAAKRAGITDVVLCVDNRKDVEEIEAQYTEGLTFHYVRDLHEVLDYALLKEKVKHPKKFL